MLVAVRVTAVVLVVQVAADSVPVIVDRAAAVAPVVSVNLAVLAVLAVLGARVLEVRQLLAARAQFHHLRHPRYLQARGVRGRIRPQPPHHGLPQHEHLLHKVPIATPKSILLRVW